MTTWSKMDVISNAIPTQFYEENGQNGTGLGDAWIAIASQTKVPTGETAARLLHAMSMQILPCAALVPRRTRRPWCAAKTCFLCLASPPPTAMAQACLLEHEHGHGQPLCKRITSASQTPSNSSPSVSELGFGNPAVTIDCAEEKGVKYCAGGFVASVVVDDNVFLPIIQVSVMLLRAPAKPARSDAAWGLSSWVYTFFSEWFPYAVATAHVYSILAHHERPLHTQQFRLVMDRYLQ